MTRISVEEAARLIGCRPDTIRAQMAKKTLGEAHWLDIGYADPPEGRRNRWNYYVLAPMLASALGFTGEQLEAELEKLRAAND